VQMGPMLGREVVKGKQHFFIFIQAFGVDPTVVSPAAILQQEHSFLLIPNTKLEYPSLAHLSQFKLRNLG
jgi:hypothetical protein